MREIAFKRSLNKVPLATEVTISSAAGSLTLHKNRAKPAVFLAGGIGITPFLSIARQAHHDRLPHKLYLFYSNRRPDDAPFLDTLQNLEKTNPNFHLIGTMTEVSKSKREWNGEVVPIDQEKLSNRHLATLQGPIYYSVGPPAMVASRRAMLVSASVDEDDIRTEDFAGY
jgi:ferredoxin-NADP reductase